MLYYREGKDYNDRRTFAAGPGDAVVIQTVGLEVIKKATGLSEDEIVMLRAEQ